MLVHIFTTIFMVLLIIRLMIHGKNLVMLNISKEIELEQTVRHIIQLFLLATPPFWGIYWMNVLTDCVTCFTEVGATILIIFIAAISMVFAVFLNDYKVTRW